MYRYNATLLYIPAAVVWLIWLIYTVFFVQKKKTVSQIVLRSLTFAYIIMVLGVGLFPIQNYPLENPPGQNFIPFKTIVELVTTLPAWIATKQIVGNMLMFLPFGLLMPFYFSRHKFLKLLGTSALFSILIESLQFTIGVLFVGSQYRVVDIDDVILNVVGAIIGFALYSLLPHKLKASLGKEVRRQRVQIYRPEIMFKKR